MVDEPETVATAIRIGHPVSWKYAWAARTESGGWFNECSDEEILKSQKLLAETEGIFCEPASAASIAGVIKDLGRGVIGRGSTIVCTLTGHGLKDPDTAIAQSSKPFVVDATRSAIEQLIGEQFRGTFRELPPLDQALGLIVDRTWQGLALGVFGITSIVHEYQRYANGPESGIWRIVLAVIFAIVMLGFGIHNFWKARKIQK